MFNSFLSLFVSVQVGDAYVNVLSITVKSRSVVLATIFFRMYRSPFLVPNEVPYK